MTESSDSISPPELSLRATRTYFELGVRARRVSRIHCRCLPRGLPHAHRVATRATGGGAAGHAARRRAASDRHRGSASRPRAPACAAQWAAGELCRAALARAVGRPHVGDLRAAVGLLVYSGCSDAKARGGRSKASAILKAAAALGDGWATASARAARASLVSRLVPSVRITTSPASKEGSEQARLLGGKLRRDSEPCTRRCVLTEKFDVCNCCLTAGAAEAAACWRSRTGLGLRSPVGPEERCRLPYSASLELTGLLRGRLALIAGRRQGKETSRSTN
eukprot:364344-Chlamydomonas_euryale.AAC.14